MRAEQSAGLVGELGIHQVDNNSWFLKALPTAVSGFGGVLQWSDGRTVPDTAQCVFEYPEGVNFIYDATLANSFDSDYEMIYGTDAAVMMRGAKAWMFKESDAPLLGWEVVRLLVVDRDDGTLVDRECDVRVDEGAERRSGVVMLLGVRCPRCTGE